MYSFIQCNGPYDGKWSKSMVGYGPEDDHFVAELTYNYSGATVLTLLLPSFSLSI